MAFPDEHYENWNYSSGTLEEGDRFLSGTFETLADATSTANGMAASGVEVWHITYTDGLRTATLADSIQTE